MTVSELRRLLDSMERDGLGEQAVYVCDGEQFVPVRPCCVGPHCEGEPVVVIDLTASDESEV